MFYLRDVENGIYDKNLDFVLKNQVESLLICYKKFPIFKYNPVKTIMSGIRFLNNKVKKDLPGAEYDFTCLLFLKGYVLVFGSGAFPVAIISHRGVRESIMLYKKKLSEMDYPLYRIGSLDEVSSWTLFRDSFKLYPPCKIFISDRDVSHMLKIKDIPILNEMPVKDCLDRLVGETKYEDKEDIDLITLCA